MNEEKNIDEERKKKQIELFDSFDEVIQSYEKTPTEGGLLDSIFRQFGGTLFSNKKQKHGVGVYPDRNAGIVIEFFEIIGDDTFKFTDRRAIMVYDYSREVFKHVLNVCEIMNNRPKKEECSMPYCQ